VFEALSENQIRLATVSAVGAGAQAGRQAGRQADRQTGRQADRHYQQKGLVVVVVFPWLGTANQMGNMARNMRLCHDNCSKWGHWNWIKQGYPLSLNLTRKYKVIT
jgi:hypothetical protein